MDEPTTRELMGKALSSVEQANGRVRVILREAGSPSEMDLFELKALRHKIDDLIALEEAEEAIMDRLILVAPPERDKEEGGAPC